MLSNEQVGVFRTQGFLLINDVLDEGDLVPVRREYEEVLDVAASELVARGHLSRTYSELAFADRYTAIVTECPEVFYYLGISLPLDYEALDEHWVRLHTGPAFFRLITNPKVLDIVEAVIGSEVAINPIQQTRMKPPQRVLSGPMASYSNVGSTTWHQDFGAALDEALDTDLLTVWIAITDATEEMGCLQVMPDSHVQQVLTLHCPGKLNPAENYIPQQLLDRHGTDALTLPCRAGSIILLSKWIEHGALDNNSNHLRWSFDLRYQPSDQPSGRPAFPKFAVRSARAPETVVSDPEDYAAGWEATRQSIVAGAVSGPLYEQARWMDNRDNPVCA